MLALVAMYTLIETIVTMWFLLILAKVLKNLKDERGAFVGHMAESLFTIMGSIPMTVIMNIAISYFITVFTGAGMLAGFANISASIIVAFIAPSWMRRIFYGEAHKSVGERIFDNASDKTKSVYAWIKRQLLLD